MHEEQVIIVGAGPCGLAAAIALQQKGIHPLVIDKGNVVHTLSRYPTHQTFFSSAEKLEIADVPFIIEQRKPSRNQALAYYREVARKKKIRIQSYENVKQVQKKDNQYFLVDTETLEGAAHTYQCEHVIIATGYYDNHNTLGVPGDQLKKVHYYFKEAHPFFDKDVVVIGGKNSAVDATLELEKAGARVTALYRGRDYSSSVKPWILPEFVSLVNHGKVKMEFEAHVKEITPHTVTYEQHGERKEIKNDFVFAMIGYHPDHSFLTKMGVDIDEETGRPHFNPDTMETNVDNIYIAGVIAAGNNANEIFIENGRYHGERIASAIVTKA
ncbi:YpdA family putative bacillithiol disulfide reductase [Caldalkalibacillus salinus]|uniref:YpdA family putative bacillithiol disulfide reductase n=1 Tax=Caldalkalibacillus salinus TaxID=2803787 RepID=UPI0019223E9C